MPSLGLVRCCEAVTGRGAVLEVHRCVASVRIDRAIQGRAVAGYATRRARCDRRRSTRRRWGRGRPRTDFPQAKGVHGQILVARARGAADLARWPGRSASGVKRQSVAKSYRRCL